MWRRREIENYFCTERTLMAYAQHDVPDDLFGPAERQKRLTAMRESIDDVAAAIKLIRGEASPWSPDIKATDEFLDPLFRRFFEKLELPLTFRKSDYWNLAAFVPIDELDPEIVEKLDMIYKAAFGSGFPRGDDVPRYKAVV